MVERWRVLPFDIGPSIQHFALSDALARRVSPPTVWAHSSNEPTLILGVGQRDLERTMPGESRVRVVRRHAGGTSVFAHPDVLGLDVALPSRHALAHYDVVEAYRWIGEVWLHAIRSLRVDAQLVSIEEARSSPPVEDIIRHACFGSLSPYEVTARGRKLVGLAQVRRRHTVLWQSGIHLRFDAEGLAALLSDANRDDLANRLHGHAVGLNEVTPSPLSLKDVVRAFEESLVQLLGIELVPGQWTDEELTRATIVR